MNCPKKQDLCGKCDEFSSSCYQLSPQRDIEQLKRQLEKAEEEIAELKKRKFIDSICSKSVEDTVKEIQEIEI
jgi:hypothetical protein